MMRHPNALSAPHIEIVSQYSLDTAILQVQCGTQLVYCYWWIIVCACCDYIDVYFGLGSYRTTAMCLKFHAEPSFSKLFILGYYNGLWQRLATIRLLNIYKHFIHWLTQAIAEANHYSLFPFQRWSTHFTQKKLLTRKLCRGHTNISHKTQFLISTNDNAIDLKHVSIDQKQSPLYTWLLCAHRIVYSSLHRTSLGCFLYTFVAEYCYRAEVNRETVWEYYILISWFANASSLIEDKSWVFWG